jgi:hypothetical protein
MLVFVPAWKFKTLMDGFYDALVSDNVTAAR